LQGSVFLLAGGGVQALLRLGSSIVLTRLLVPEHFGIVSLVLVIIGGAETVSNVGVQAKLIQRNRIDDPGFRETAWTVQVGRGILVSALVLLLAQPISSFYGEPDLAALLPVAGLAALINGFSSTRLSLLKRDLRFGWVTIIPVVGQLSGIAVSIAWAAVHASAWAIVAGHLCMVLVGMILSHALVPGPADRIGWSREHSREILGFGIWIFGTAVLSFLAFRIDRLLLGKLVSMEVLGVYSIALTFTRVAARLVQRIINNIGFSAFARFARQSLELLPAKVRESRRITVPVVAFVTLSVGMGCQIFFQLLYPESFAAAGWMAQLLAIGLWFQLLQKTVDRIPLALGEPDFLFYYQLVLAVARTIGALGGFYLADLPGFIVGAGIATLAGHIPIHLYLRRRNIYEMRGDVAYTVVLAALAAPYFAGVDRKLIPGSPYAYPLAVIALTGLWAAWRCTPLLRRLR